MAGHVIDGEERDVERNGDGFGSRETDEERAGQAGAISGSDGVEIVEGKAGLRQHLADHGLDQEEMLTAGKLRDDAAIGLMKLDLRADDVG